MSIVIPGTLIEEEIAAVTREEHEALAKAHECAAIRKRLQALLARGAEMGTPSPGVPVAPVVVPVPSMRVRIRRESPREGTIRFAVQEFIAQAGAFSQAELQSAIEQQFPNANPGTVRAELSFAKSKGLVESLGSDQWRGVQKPELGQSSLPEEEEEELEE